MGFSSIHHVRQAGAVIICTLGGVAAGSGISSAVSFGQLQASKEIIIQVVNGKPFPIPFFTLQKHFFSDWNAFGLAHINPSFGIVLIAHNGVRFCKLQVKINE